MGTGEYKKEAKYDNNKYNNTFFITHDYLLFSYETNDKKTIIICSRLGRIDTV